MEGLRQSCRVEYPDTLTRSGAIALVVTWSELNKFVPGMRFVFEGRFVQVSSDRLTVEQLRNQMEELFNVCILDRGRRGVVTGIVVHC